MPQLQTQVPHPLAHDTPCLLTTRGVTTPTIGVDLLIFVSKRRFKGPAMQVQLDDIGSGECLLRQGGEEEFVNDTRTREANRALFGVGRMSCDDHAAQHTRGSHRHLWTIVEAAHQLTFWTRLELIGWQVQTRLCRA